LTQSGETTYAGKLGEWGRWLAALSPKEAGLEHLEALRVQLEGLAARGSELIRKQSEWTAAKQDASQELRVLMVEGERLVTLLRVAVRQSYGISSEQLAKFGIQPFRGRRKAVDAPVIEQPKAEPQTE